MTKFNGLPKEVQEKVRGILKAYDSVNVWYEYGEYTYVDALTAELVPDENNPLKKWLACTDWYGEINEQGNFELTEKRTVLM